MDLLLLLDTTNSLKFLGRPKRVRFAQKEGIGRKTPWPDESKLQAIRQHIGRPGVTTATGEAEQRLKARTEQIRA